MSSMQNASTYFGYLNLSGYIALQSLYLPIGCCSILGNSIVLLSYLKYKQLREIEYAHLVAALALSDLICGIGAIIIGLARLETAILLDFNYTKFYCVFSAIINLFGIEMSQSMTMAIAIDRLLAIWSPLSYQKRNHHRYAKISFLVALSSCGFILILSTVGVDFSKPSSRCSWTGSVSSISVNIFVSGNTIFSLIIAAIYAIIAYKQRKWIKHTAGGRVSESTKRFLEKQAKVTATLTRLVIVYCVLVAIPLTTMEIWILLNISPVFSTNVLSPLRNICMSLNSALNVVVYARSSSNLRPFLIRLLRGKKYPGIDGATSHVNPITHPSLRNKPLAEPRG